MALQYDEFEDGVIAPFWEQVVSGGGMTLSEKGGKFIWTQTDNGQTDLQQTPTKSFDVYTKIAFSSYDSQQEYAEQMSFWFYDNNTYDWYQCWFVWENTVLGWKLHIYGDTYRLATDEFAESAIHTVEQSYCWLRIKCVSGGGCTLYYSLTEPTQNGDWTDITPELPSGPWAPTLPSVNLRLGYYVYCQPQIRPRSFWLYYFRSWLSGIYPSSRVRSSDINFKNATPLKVEDMKIGELRFAEDKMFGRVGNQVLSVDCDIYYPTTTTTTTTTTAP